MARASAAAHRDGSRFVCERAHHAMQRLRPRDAMADRFLQARPAAGPWLLAAVLLGLGLGLLVDRIGPSQRINLLAVPIGLLLLWNVAVYLVLALQALLPARARRGLRQRLPALWSSRLPGSQAPGPLQRLSVDWGRASAPANAARAALLLHAAAAALALGVVAGLYARGLVLDYRAGWQSTFLEPATVRQLLALVLAPASAVTGLAVPGVEAIAALRVGPDGAAQGPAAGWLHLIAATLALVVVGPRLLLAAVAAWHIRQLSRCWPLPWSEPYFQALLRTGSGQALQAWVLPHAAPPSAAAERALQALLDAAADDAVPLRVGMPVGLGHEDDAARCVPPDGTTLALVLVDMASTPEADAQGRLLGTLSHAASAMPRVLLLDEAAFVTRFAALPQRLQQRRQAWQALADQHGVPLCAVDLSGRKPDADAAQALRRLMEG